MNRMETVDMNPLYNEIRLVRKKLEYLEDVLIPEEGMTGKELKEIDRLRKEALAEHRKGQSISVDDL